MAYDFSVNTPDIRNTLLRIADEEYKKCNFLRSIYYQTRAIGVGIETKYLVKEAKGTSIFYYTDKAKYFTREDCLTTFLEKFNTEKFIKIEKNENKCVNVDTEINHFINSCHQFPNEWTILQLCKAYNPEATISTQSEIICSKQSIFLSILHHFRSDKFKYPVCIKIGSNKNLRYMYEKFHLFGKGFKKATTTEDFNSKISQVRYNKGLTMLEEEIKESVTDLKEFLGPWIYLFAGDVYQNNKPFQNQLFQEVDEFCNKFSLHSSINVVLSMIVRFANILSVRDVKNISITLMKMKCSKISHIDYYNFFEAIKKRMDFPKLCFKPCILIVDEIIDNIFWEMVFPDQEICRVSSFYMLQKLFVKYKKNIKDGYVEVKVEKGNCVINPDQTLLKMEKRMKNFISYWIPHWYCFTGILPSSEQFQDFICNADTFIYCGHGSGLQHFHGYKISKCVIEAVVFLFGCESVKLKSDGLHSEMIASHIYYHSALCPAVIGCLHIALDYQLDEMSSNIITRWIQSEQLNHWKNIDKAVWRKTGEITSLKATSVNSYPYQGSLSRVLSNIRSEQKDNFLNKSIIIYRGLPVWNSDISTP